MSERGKKERKRKNKIQERKTGKKERRNLAGLQKIIERNDVLYSHISMTAMAPGPVLTPTTGAILSIKTGSFPVMAVIFLENFSAFFLSSGSEYSQIAQLILGGGSKKVIIKATENKFHQEFPRRARL